MSENSTVGYFVFFFSKNDDNLKNIMISNFEILIFHVRFNRYKPTKN